MKITVLPLLCCLLGTTAALAQTYETWRSQKFTAAEAADEAISGRFADPDHDGKTNYLEYALGTEPKIADAGDQPIGSLDADGLLRLGFPRRKNAPGTVLLPQVSTDFIRWRSGPVYFDELGAAPLTADLEAVLLREAAPALASPRRFIRLYVADDTNGNGIPDAWELAAGLSLTDPDAIHRDSDGDGVPDGQELMDGTDPFDYYNGHRRHGIPAAPANVRVTTNPDGSKLVEWDDMSDNEEYFIIYDDLPGGGRVELGRTGPGQTSFFIPAPAQ